MKKLLFLNLGLFATIFLFAQTKPAHWNKGATTLAMTVVEETSNVQLGTKAAKITWTSQDNQDLEADLVNVTAGAEFTITFHAFDNDPAGRCRVGIFWGTSSTWVDNTYSADNTAWQEITYTGTVPAGATQGKIIIRFYDVAASWGGTASIIVDNISYSENGGANLLLNHSFEDWILDVPEPELNVSSPVNNAIIYGNSLNVIFTTVDFVLGTDGKVKYTLDGNAPVYTTTSPISLNGLNLGAHTIILELVDMSNNSLSPQVIKTINFTCEEELEGNIETFDNSNATTSYGDGSFIGNNNITWNYFHSRDQGDYAIEGKGLMLRRGSDSKLVSQEISGGIGNFSVQMRKAFTSAASRAVELYINNVLIATSESFGATSGEDNTIHTFTVNNINTEGNITIMLKPQGSATTNQQITIDNISWTSYSSSSDEPSLTITSPANNTVLNTTNVNISFTTANFILGTDGKVKYSIDNGSSSYTTTSPISLTGLSYGNHVVNFELVNMANSPLTPAVTASLNFSIVQLQPTLSISSPSNGQNINGNEVDIVFNVTNFSLGTDGKLAVKVDNTPVYYTTSNSPIELTGLSYASHTVNLELVDMSQNSLSPSVTTSVNFTCTESLPGGMETFDNSNATTFYEDGSFEGNNGIMWYYYHSRDEGDYPINGKGIMLRRASVSKLQSGEIGGGIGNFEMKMKKAFTGTKPRQVELYINGNLVGTSDVFGTTSGDDPTIYTFSLQNINIGGSFTMMIKNVGATEDNTQFVIDDISWTQFATVDPYLVINSPANNTTVYNPNLNIVYSVYNFNLGTDGKVKYVLDNGTPQYSTESPIVLLDLTNGDHTINLELVSMNNQPLTPAVTASVNFTVNLSGPTTTPIYDIQYSETSPYESAYNNQIVTVEGVVTANFNGTQYGKGYFIQDAPGAWNGLYIYDLNHTPTIGDMVRVKGKITEYFGMTEMTNITEYTVTSIGEPVPAPVLVSTADAALEKYESVLVKVQNAECVVAQNNFGEWKVNDGTGELVCKENGAFAFQEVVGHHYNIIGVMMYSYSVASLQYRIPSDITESTSIETELSKTTSIYPNPAKNIINISSEYNLNSISIITIDGKVALNQNVNNSSSSIDISSLPNGIYFIKLESDNLLGIKKLIIE